jgi:Cthe_2314-like HEPN
MTMTLSDHDFTKLVLGDARPILAKYAPRRRDSLEPDGGVPDEYEFYVWRVASAHAALISSMGRLSQSVLFLSAYRETKALDAAKVTRTDHLLFGIENFIIWTQTIYDRVLRLVDAVFHLMNDEQSLNHELLLNNLRVRRNADVVSILKRVRKKARQYSQERNALVHHGTWQDDDARLLELATQLEESYKREGGARPPEFESLYEVRKEQTREVLGRKRRQFLSFIRELTELLDELLKKLTLPFQETKKNLARGIGRETT